MLSQQTPGSFICVARVIPNSSLIITVIVHGRVGTWERLIFCVAVLLWKWVSSSAVLWWTAMNAVNTLWRHSVKKRCQLLHPLFPSASFFPFYAGLWCRRLNLFLMSVELECLQSGRFCKSLDALNRHIVSCSLAYGLNAGRKMALLNTFVDFVCLKTGR